MLHNGFLLLIAAVHLILAGSLLPAGLRHGRRLSPGELLFCFLLPVSGPLCGHLFLRAEDPDPLLLAEMMTRSEVVHRSYVAPVQEAKETAPVGVELTTSSTPEKLLSDTEETASLLFLSHASWIGPNSFSEISDPLLEKKLERVMNMLGYRFRVSELRLSISGNGQASLSLNFFNDGSAPFYYSWPVLLRVSLEDGSEQLLPLPLDLQSLLPGKSQTVTVTLPAGTISSLSVGILDPMTGEPSVRFAMDTGWKEGWQTLL